MKLEGLRNTLKHFIPPSKISGLQKNPQNEGQSKILSCENQPNESIWPENSSRAKFSDSSTIAKDEVYSSTVASAKMSNETTRIEYFSSQGMIQAMELVFASSHSGIHFSAHSQFPETQASLKSEAKPPTMAPENSSIHITNTEVSGEGINSIVTSLVDKLSGDRAVKKKIHSKYICD